MGDRVVGLDHLDASQLTHADAQNIFKHAGTAIKLDIVRPNANQAQSSNPIPPPSSFPKSTTTANIDTMDRGFQQQQPQSYQPPMAPRQQQSYQPPSHLQQRPIQVSHQVGKKPLKRQQCIHLFNKIIIPEMGEGTPLYSYVHYNSPPLLRHPVP